MRSLERLENIIITNLSYERVQIKDNSVIYCDPPYKDTYTYQKGKNIDYEKFYKWCLDNNNPVFISGYEMPEQFTLIRAFKEHCCKLSPTNKSKKVTENLYWNNKLINN